MKNLDIFVVCQKHSSVFFCIEYLLEAQTIFETSHYSLKMKTCCKTTQSLQSRHQLSIKSNKQISTCYLKLFERVNKHFLALGKVNESAMIPFIVPD